jgi:hypothetical protein
MIILCTEYLGLGPPRALARQAQVESPVPSKTGKKANIQELSCFAVFL